jgi:hypothetical protein
MTPVARSIQLEALKRKRKALSRLALRKVASELLLQEEHEVTLADFVREIQRISMAGVMPSMAVYNMAKPVTWPTALELCQRFEMDWYDMTEEAGLRWKR